MYYIAVELLSDILKNSKFENSQVERERGVILREMEVCLILFDKFVGN